MKAVFYLQIQMTNELRAPVMHAQPLFHLAEVVDGHLENSLEELAHIVQVDDVWCCGVVHQ
jgi:hypothetical protein